MAKNKFKVDEQQNSGGSVFARLEKAISVDKIFNEGLPIKYMPHMLFSVAICVFYIGNSHYAEKTIRKIDQTKKDVRDLRADYTTLKADYMYASKQSEVAKRVAKLGLCETPYPPLKIKLK